MRTAAALVTAALCSSPLVAQSIHGEVVDSVRLVPVSGVSVELLSPQRVVLRSASDADGRFVLAVPSPGSYRIRVQQLGYRPLLSQPIPVAANTDTLVPLLLVPLAFELAPVTVTASSAAFLRNSGFYERKQSDPGYFMTPDMVGNVAPKARQTADIFDGIPGVTLAVAGGSKGTRFPVFTGRSGMGCVEPRVFLDGMLMNPGASDFDVNEILPADVLAIELYRRVSEVPLKFGGSDAACGAIAIWTKH